MHSETLKLAWIIFYWVIKTDYMQIRKLAYCCVLKSLRCLDDSKTGPMFLSVTVHLCFVWLKLYW